MACNREGAPRILARLYVEKLGQIAQLEPSNLVGQTCDKHSGYGAYREHLGYEVDFTAALGLVCLPEDYLVLRVAKIGASAHQSHVEFLALVKQLCSFDTTFNFSLADQLEAIDLIDAETLRGSYHKMITACIE